MAKGVDPTPAAEAGPAAPGRSLLGPLRVRDYRWLWLGQSGGFASFWLLQVLQGWLVLELTDSPFLVSLSLAFNQVPMLVSSLPGGILADRVDRRKLLLVTRTVVALTMATMAFGAIAGWINEWHVFGLTVVMGVMWSLDGPSRQALIADLVHKDHVMHAVAFNFASMSGARILGPALGAVMVAAVGLRLTFTLPIVGALGMLAGLAMLRVPARPAQLPGLSPVGQVRNGLAYVVRDRQVLAVIAMVASIELLGWAFMPLLPVLVKDVLRGGASDVGVLLAASGVGALVGALFLAFLRRSRAKGWWLLAAAGAFGAIEVLLGLSHWYALSFVILMAAGMASTCYMTLNNTILLTVTPEALRGRVMSVYSLCFGLSGVGAIMAGAIAEVRGVPFTIVLSGSLAVAVALAVAVLAPGLRKLK